MQNRRCLNCDLEHHGSFCPECGQTAATGRLSLRQIIHDIVSHVLSLDGKALRTVVGLTRNPGRVCLRYVKGKRVRYVQPLRYFLTLLAASLLLNLLAGFDPSVSVSSGAQVTPAQEQLRLSLTGFATQHIDLVILAALPLFIAAMRLLFRGAGFNYAEVSVLVLFVLGHATLLGLLLFPLKLAVPPAAAGLKFLLQASLFSWASVVFFDVSVAVSIVKNLLATLLYFVLLILSIVVLTLPQILSVIRDLS